MDNLVTMVKWYEVGYSVTIVRYYDKFMLEIFVF